MKFRPFTRLSAQTTTQPMPVVEVPAASRRITGKLLTGVCISALLCACQSQPSKPDESELAIAEENDAPTIEKVADKPFETDTLYSLLVAEMAIDRKRYDIALGNYIQQATNTQDPMIAERATQIARGLNARQSALEMSQLWAKLDPSDTDANIVAINELIQGNKFIEAFELSKNLHAKKVKHTAFDRIAVGAERASEQERQALIDGYAALAAEKSKHPDLWVGYSVLLLQAKDYDTALSAAQRASELDGHSVTSIFQESRVLQAMGNEEQANKKLADLVEDHPENIGLRARYARLLWSSDPAEAERQFEILYDQSPDDAEILYSLALVKKERGDVERAQTLFKALLLKNQYPEAAHYNLGELAEAREDYALALEHYRKIKSGQNYAAAAVRTADILIEQNRRNEALDYIEAEKTQQDGPYLESLYLIEADIYSQANRMKPAEDALSEGITQFPQSTRLLYARAMLYAQIDYITAAEKDLKQVIELVPDNAAALNALGYTLADRTERYTEAETYIKRAYAITPNDPAVMDSMGWIAFRMGRIDEALNYLKKAMLAMPDHEIAAHLGEVLWTTGEQEAAKAIWKKGLEIEPESKIIHKTLHRLNADVE